MEKQAVVGFIPKDLYRALVEHCDKFGKSLDELVSQVLAENLPKLLAPAKPRPKPKPSPPLLQGEFSCQICSKKFGTIYALHGHMASHKKK